MEQKATRILFISALGLVLAVPAWTQEKDSPDTKETKKSSTVQMVQASGAKQKAKGIIVQRDSDSFVMREETPAGVSMSKDDRGDIVVKLTGSTQIVERKGNPFRGAKKYAAGQLVRGLQVEVEGRGDGSGALLADKIRFTADELMVAGTVESRVTPVEGRVGEAETRLAQSEQNAQRLSGQIEELSAISNAARGGAKAAQATADVAMAGADAAITGVNHTNERITALDDYEPQKGITVSFKVGSARLSEESRAALDQIATDAKAQKGFVIEVTGFASADGAENYNRQLSRRRADAVVQYLAENHDIPLRRIITPFGYGELKPVADNKSRDGRQQNRRVEVKILVSRGLMNPVSVNKPAPPVTD